VRRFTGADLPARVDLLVVGGGVTGAATARDAALRGLSVALVEREDFAAGTSSRSTKLVHGGLRYLRSYQFKLVHESVRERELMLRLAPHLTAMRPFIYLLYEGDPESRALLNLGLTFYDGFARVPWSRRHRMLSPAKVAELEPHLATDGLRGGGWYYDALTDDARVTVDTLKSAAESGALIANHREVVGLITERGRVAGARVADRLGGEDLEIRARLVLNTAGPWVDRVLGLGGPRPPLLRPTKGAHIVLRKADFPLEHAVFLRAPRDNRVVWPIPALDGEHVYIGTTDTYYERPRGHDGPIDDVVADSDDVAYLLEVANRTIPDARLDPSHVVASWAGLRPLVAPEGDRVAESSVPREHVIRPGPDGMLTMAGGKLTTARVMAAQLVDAAVERLAADHGVRGVPASTTGKVPLSGGDPAAVFRAGRAITSVPDPVGGHWLARYGGNAEHLAALATTPAATEVIGPGTLTRAEIAHAVKHEMAKTLDDLMIRRVSAFFWSADGGLSAIDTVSRELAAHLGWTEDERTRQVAAYAERVRRNRPQ
jgi:glycerol-3-phosphate dehydrogenase